MSEQEKKEKGKRTWAGLGKLKNRARQKEVSESTTHLIIELVRNDGTRIPVGNISRNKNGTIVLSWIEDRPTESDPHTRRRISIQDFPCSTLVATPVEPDECSIDVNSTYKLCTVKREKWDFCGRMVPLGDGSCDVEFGKVPQKYEIYGFATKVDTTRLMLNTLRAYQSKIEEGVKG